MRAFIQRCLSVVCTLWKLVKFPAASDIYIYLYIFILFYFFIFLSTVVEVSPSFYEYKQFVNLRTLSDEQAINVPSTGGLGGTELLRIKNKKVDSKKEKK